MTLKRLNLHLRRVVMFRRYTMLQTGLDKDNSLLFIFYYFIDYFRSIICYDLKDLSFMNVLERVLSLKLENSILFNI